MTFEAMMKAEIKRRWPDDPWAVGKWALKGCKRTKAANVMELCSFIQWGNFVVEPEEVGGNSGHVKRCVMK